MPRARNTFGLRRASHGCPTLLSPTYIILLWNYLKATLQILISILMTEPSQDPLNKDLEVKTSAVRILKGPAPLRDSSVINGKNFPVTTPIPLTSQFMFHYPAQKFSL